MRVFLGCSFSLCFPSVFYIADFVQQYGSAIVAVVLLFVSIDNVMWWWYDSLFESRKWHDSTHLSVSRLSRIPPCTVQYVSHFNQANAIREVTSRLLFPGVSKGVRSSQNQSAYSIGNPVQSEFLAPVIPRPFFLKKTTVSILYWLINSDKPSLLSFHSKKRHGMKKETHK